MQKTMGWWKSRAILIQEMLLDIAQHGQLVSDIIQLHINMSVDTMAGAFC